MRTVKCSWFKEFDWLRYDSGDNKFFCMTCEKEAKQNTFTKGKPAVIPKKDDSLKHERIQDHNVALLFELLRRQKDNQKRTFTSYSSLTAEVYTFTSSSSNDANLHHTMPSPMDNSLNPTTAFSVQNLSYRVPSSNEILCKNLTFQLESGINVLLTGESGCGKSSLLRIISGLWPVSSGNIKCNVHLGTNGIMFLPQKPYFTDGSLLQQVIYPEDENNFNYGVDVTDRVFGYLQRVQLHCLVSRVARVDSKVDWDWYNELSPGQQQRLCFARLFYHQPRFAILDESTSQISQDSEQIMYSLCKEFGITVLSVGHRQSLQQYHQMELHIEGSGDWTMKPLVS